MFIARELGLSSVQVLVGRDQSCTDVLERRNLASKCVPLDVAEAAEVFVRRLNNIPDAWVISSPAKEPHGLVEGDPRPQQGPH